MADHLRQRISSGDWPPGHRIPSETTLVTQFDVSRVTVRQAVAALRTEGLILTRQGMGSFVRDDVRPQHRIVANGVCRVAEVVDWSVAAGPVGQPLTWVWESVQARMPTPQERHDLNLAPGVPVLALTRHSCTGPRVGADQIDDRPPATVVLPADRTILDYHIALHDPTKPIAAMTAVTDIPAAAPDSPLGPGQAAAGIAGFAS